MKYKNVACVLDRSFEVRMKSIFCNFYVFGESVVLSFATRDNNLQEERTRFIVVE